MTDAQLLARDLMDAIDQHGDEPAPTLEAVGTVLLNVLSEIDFANISARDDVLIGLLLGVQRGLRLIDRHAAAMH